MALIVRFVLVVAGWIAALLAASLFLNLLVLGGFQAGSDEGMTGLPASMIVTVPGVAAIIGYHTFFPAIAFILAAELLARRDWLFHALSGAAVAAIGSVWLWTVQPEAALDSGQLAAAVAAGIVAGWAYWLVAGRGAGAWRGEPTSTGSSRS